MPAPINSTTYPKIPSDYTANTPPKAPVQPAGPARRGARPARCVTSTERIVDVCQSTKSLCSAKNRPRCRDLTPGEICNLVGSDNGRFVIVLDAKHRNKSIKPPPSSKVEDLHRTLNMMNQTKTALVRECKPADGPKICSRLHIRA
ncbi:MAG: hypothetical protein K2M00_00175, partial [Muribaculaceae bacterium]|nr:hypothetical protein [Muribaculaceae bacterium]